MISSEYESLSNNHIFNICFASYDDKNSLENDYWEDAQRGKE